MELGNLNNNWLDNLAISYCVSSMQCVICIWQWSLRYSIYLSTYRRDLINVYNSALSDRNLIPYTMGEYLQYIYVHRCIAVFAIRCLVSYFCCFQIRRLLAKNKKRNRWLRDFRLYSPNPSIIGPNVWPRLFDDIKSSTLTHRRTVCLLGQ